MPKEIKVKIFIIAQNTFRETIRDRVLRVIVGLCLVIIIASRAIAEISLGQDLRIIADMSLGAIDLFGVVLCVFIGTGMIYKEIDKRTLYTVLSRPIHRWEFIIGKYLGMGATLVVTIFLMGTVFCLFFLLNGGTLNWIMLGCVFLLWVGLMLLNAVAIFFSTMASPTVSAISTVIVFIVGRATYELKYFSEMYQGIVKNLIMGFYYFLPNFSNFNIKIAAIHNKLTAVSHVQVTPTFFLWSVLYCFLYSAFLLFLASIIFKKRNL